MSELITPPLPLTVAVSPCPNDTFIFGAWVLGQCAPLPDQTASFIWEDVQVLNEAAARRAYDVVKVSAAQALKLLDDYVLLPAGGAFSKVHGPKLVTSRTSSLSPSGAPRTIAVPGLGTTAAALLRRAWSEPAELIPVRYDRIVNMVLQGEVDAGLLIHESALLLDRYGLSCILDLGRWWDERTRGLPLPLGCILGRRTLRPETLERITAQIQASLNHAAHAPDSIWPLVRALAQELDDEVLQAHIRTYVNHYSRDMGEEGTRALECLGEMVRDAAPRAVDTSSSS
ncbi:1,4-dihydroxy-6-naphthoate synthase [Desulfonatronum thiodismutans]|uniref:1,4-dihydroxy-6-naphthoate synthase n=1 Tax=Desulfonatronum thiodismutans TaxID=159290 RepID=UPI0004ABD92C|nr:1,4-dihydroxy-6-naphthoate synthase [Desulfonatronum thiodismutans]